MKNFTLMTFLLLLPFFGIAQNCIYPFSAATWLSGSKVRISPDGSKFYVTNATGPNGNTNLVWPAVSSTSQSIKTYDVSAAGVVYNSSQSFAGSNSLFSDFTANNGYFYTMNTSGAFHSINFMSSTGATFNLGTYYYPIFSTITGAPNKMIARINLGSGNNNTFLILDATNPAAPTATTVVCPGNASAVDGSISAGDNNPNFGASATDDRIYYVTTENESNGTQAPSYRFKIKAATLAGVTPVGWTDLVIQRGTVANMRVRPSDGRVFGRLGYTNLHYDMHGWIIFDKNGAASTDMNLTDLSIVGGDGIQICWDLNFDTDGNIYANKWMSGGGHENGVSTGLVKFDPKGNIDVSFLRNAWNSYGQAASSGASTFDIADNGLIIKSTYPASSSFTDFYALNINHINTNNEDPSTTYSSTNGTTGGFRPGFGGSTYSTIQFLFNNGRLVLPNMTQTNIDANCGVADPEVVPQTPTAAGGTIDCAKTAFISAPVQGTPSNIVIRVTLNVSTIGTFSPIEVSGSGFSLADPNYTISTTTTGVQTFFIPVVYDGSALTSVVIHAGQAGTCTADLTGLPQETKKAVIDIWTPENCTFMMAGPKVK